MIRVRLSRPLVPGDREYCHCQAQAQAGQNGIYIYMHGRGGPGGVWQLVATVFAVLIITTQSPTRGHCSKRIWPPGPESHAHAGRASASMLNRKITGSKSQYEKL
jgi:hypothetical protein